MRRVRVVIAIPVAVALLVAASTWLYINVIEGDPAPKLTLEADETPTGQATGELGPVQGTWNVSSGSEAGYRVKEVLFGQSTTAVGRTTAVTGAMTLEGTSVTEGSFSVDMTTVTSDERRRDRQFHGRIMETGTFPTATFVLTKPVDFGAEPPPNQVATASATGDLTLHGVTRSASFEVEAKRTAAGIQVSGSIPVVFADYRIENPSNVAARTEDHGVLEFLLTLVAA